MLFRPLPLQRMQTRSRSLSATSTAAAQSQSASAASSWSSLQSYKLMRMKFSISFALAAFRATTRRHAHTRTHTPKEPHTHTPNASIDLRPCVPMRNLRFRQFVLAGKNRYRIHHELVQKIVARKFREPPASGNASSNGSPHQHRPPTRSQQIIVQLK